jgi:hypothetical protein
MTISTDATLNHNNDAYALSVYTVIRQLRNRGWLNFAHTIYNRYSAFCVQGGTFPENLTMTGAEFKERLISYCQENPLTMEAIADGGNGFLKTMIEVCEYQRSNLDS